MYLYVSDGSADCCIAKAVKGKGNIGFQVLHDDDFMFGF